MHGDTRGETYCNVVVSLRSWSSFSAHRLMFDISDQGTEHLDTVDELQDTLKGLAVDDKTRKQIDELTDMLRGNLDKVVQHGKRADGIVKNMLLHSREGSGEHRVVDVNALVEESLNLAYHGARAEKQGFNVTLERSLDPAAGAADVFPQDITRVLINLISNGFYAASRRKGAGRRWLRADFGRRDAQPRRSRRNPHPRQRHRHPARGEGKDIQPLLYNQTGRQGTGLGLSISHDVIVKQHGGSIDVETEPGAFSEFIIVLPRVERR